MQRPWTRSTRHPSSRPSASRGRSVEHARMRVAAGVGAVALAGLAIALVTGALGALAALIVVPLAASAIASARTTALAAALALTLALLAGIPHHEFGPPHVAALLAIGLAGVSAMALVADRARRERSAAYETFLG